MLIGIATYNNSEKELISAFLEMIIQYAYVEQSLLIKHLGYIGLCSVLLFVEILACILIKVSFTSEKQGNVTIS